MRRSGWLGVGCQHWKFRDVVRFLKCSSRSTAGFVDGLDLGDEGERGQTMALREWPEHLEGSCAHSQMRDVPRRGWLGLGRRSQVGLDVFSLDYIYVQAGVSVKNFHTILGFKEKVGSWDMNPGIISEMETKSLRAGRAGGFVCKSVCIVYSWHLISCQYRSYS